MAIEYNLNSDPLVSIIIPSYNYGDLISETLNSILDQSYENWEAIIVNDGSYDNTELVVMEYEQRDNRFRYFFQMNKGLSAARNSGIQLAYGKYIQFLDADDKLSVHKLSEQVKYMEANELNDINYTDANYFVNNDMSVLYKDIHLGKSHWMPKSSGYIQSVLPDLIKRNIMPVNCALIKTSFIRQENLFYDTDYRSLEDWDFWLRCLLAGAHFKFIEKQDCYALIRIHGKSMTNNISAMILYEIKLRNHLQSRIADVKRLNMSELLEFNKLQIKQLSRRLLRPDDKIIYNELYRLTRAIGWWKAFLFLGRELNALRKNKWK